MSCGGAEKRLFHSRKEKEAVSGRAGYRLTESKSFLQSAAALAFLGGTAGATTTGVEIDTAVEFKPIHVEIDFNGLRTFKELFVDDVLITVHFKLFVCVIGLIQSHGQAGAASSAFVQKDSNGANLFVTKIGCDLFSGRRCYFEHDILLKKN
jgi:hypothetical protein